jgi:hypothetical protein
MDMEIARASTGVRKGKRLDAQTGVMVVRFLSRAGTKHGVLWVEGSGDRPETDTRQAGCAQALIVICAGGERKRDARIALAMQKGYHLILQCRILLVRATAAGRRRMRARWAVCISQLQHVCARMHPHRRGKARSVAATAVRACGRLGSADR